MISKNTGAGRVLRRVIEQHSQICRDQGGDQLPQAVHPSVRGVEHSDRQSLQASNPPLVTQGRVSLDSCWEVTVGLVNHLPWLTPSHDSEPIHLK